MFTEHMDLFRRHHDKKERINSKIHRLREISKYNTGYYLVL